jgi:hypothetical protein
MACTDVRSSEIICNIYTVLQLIDHWDNCAAASFMSFAFTLGTLGMNISARLLSAGDDMTRDGPVGALDQRISTFGDGSHIFLGGGSALLSMGNTHKVRVRL